MGLSIVMRLPQNGMENPIDVSPVPAQDLLRVSHVEWADQGPLDFHAVAFNLLADVATLPPSTKSLQARRDFPWFQWEKTDGK